MRKIGVGIVGAGVRNPGWASLAHVPAVNHLEEFTLQAVSASSQESAEAAAAAHGAASAYPDARSLAEDPAVDLVVAAVRVTRHQEVVEAGLAAGKMVFSEWPLSGSPDDAESLAAAAKSAGVRTVIGLQGRYVPEVRHARALIEDGYIGRPLATTMVASALSWGGTTDSSHAYLFDAGNGVTTLSVTGMHALESIVGALAEPSSLSALEIVGRPEVLVADESRTIPVTSPDQVALAGVLGDGVLLSAHFRGGSSRGQNFHWEINGTEGDLILTAGPHGNVQSVELSLAGGRGGETTVAAIPLPTEYSEEPAAPLTNPARGVAELYARLARDIREDTAETPGFEYALERHRLLAELEGGGFSNE
ncbi:MAG TPA: Gfo/Idh/MocA family oxidoreductase [Solirubrobacterales bacterium]